MTDQTKDRAAIYTRISRDKNDEGLGIERQEQDCRRLAETMGLEIVDVYDENDMSASTRSTKVRPKFEELMTRAEAGEFDAIVAYSNSRLTRRPKEWERLIDVTEKHGVKFHTVVSGSADLSTADGRAVARTIAAWDGAEAERTSERGKRAVKQRAEKGQFHGGTAPFGYELGEPDANGIVRSLRINPSEAAIVKRIASEILGQQTLYRIAQNLKRDGIRTRKVAMRSNPEQTRGGKFFGPQVIRTLMLSPTIAGLTAWTDRDKKGRPKGESQLFDAGWPGILDRKDWDEISRILRDPARDFAKGLRGGYGGKRALGGGLAVCGVCGHKLVSAPLCRHKPDENGKRPCDDDPEMREREVRLVCKVNADGGCGKVGVPNVQLEEFILNLVWARLDDPEFVTALRKPVEKVNDREGVLKAERRLLDGRLERVQEGFLAGILDARKAKQETEGIEQQQQKIDKELEALRTRDSLAGVSNAEDGQALWSRSSVLARREFLTSMIRQIKVNEWPRDENGRKLPSMLTRRTDSRRRDDTETQEEFEQRKAKHAADVLRLRIPPQNIEWVA